MIKINEREYKIELLHIAAQIKAQQQSLDASVCLARAESLIAEWAVRAGVQIGENHDND